MMCYHDDDVALRPREQRLRGEARQRLRDTARSAAAPRIEKSPLRSAVRRALNGDGSGSDLGKRLVHALAEIAPSAHRMARQLLGWSERHMPDVLENSACAAAIVRIAGHHKLWNADAFGFIPAQADAASQVRALARHVFGPFALPRWLARAWFSNDRVHQRWAIHLAGGGNLADAPGLPFPLTRRAAHFAVTAPLNLHARQALRWGQLRGMGLDEDVCREAINTRLSTTLPDEPFWKTFGQWLVANPEVIGNVTQIVDYVFAQRVGHFGAAPQPDFKVTGRRPDALLREARQWHRELAIRQNAVQASWLASGIAQWIPLTESGEPASVVIEELLTADALADEGAALNHCVLSYVRDCAQRRVAIFSLRRREGNEMIPLTTIEVWIEQRAIVQARGKFNAYPEERERRLIREWAKLAGLRIEAYVWPAQRGDRFDR